MAKTYSRKRIPCEICRKPILQQKFQIHSRSHTGERPYPCITCNKAFRSKDILTAHQKLHSGVKQFSCNVCKKQFTYKGNLQQHSVIHSDEKHYTCEFCGMGFKHLNTYKTHLSRHEGQEAKTGGTIRFPCAICGCRYKTRYWLLRHMKRDHKLEDCDKFECIFCKKIIQPASDYEIEYHISSHTEETPFFCKFCSSEFRIVYSLKHHLRIHKAKGAFRDGHECVLCGKTFCIKQLFQKHLLIHIQERPHICNVCSTEFLTKDALRKHVKIHEAVRPRPFQCDLCPSRSYTKPSLRAHIKTHLCERPFRCGICNKDFKNQPVLRNHLRLFHSNEFRDGK